MAEITIPSSQAANQYESASDFVNNILRSEGFSGYKTVGRDNGSLQSLAPVGSLQTEVPALEIDGATKPDRANSLGLPTSPEEGDALPHIQFHQSVRQQRTRQEPEVSDHSSQASFELANVGGQKRRRLAVDHVEADSSFRNMESEAGGGNCGPSSASTYKDASLDAMHLLQVAADAGVAEAQCTLALNYFLGQDGFDKNAEQAKALFQKAAAQEYPMAIYGLGVMLKDETCGVEPDVKEAMFLISKAASLGFPFAQYDMGTECLGGKYVPRDVNKAIEWYEKAGAQGYAKAHYVLGLIFGASDSAKRDRAKAMMWLDKAIAQGGKAQAAQKWPQFREAGRQGPGSVSMVQHPIIAPTDPIA